MVELSGPAALARALEHEFGLTPPTEPSALFAKLPAASLGAHSGS